MAFCSFHEYFFIASIESKQVPRSGNFSFGNRKIQSQLSLYAMAHYRPVNSTYCSPTNLAVSDRFSHANASIRPNRKYQRKQWASPWLFSNFNVIFSVLAPSFVLNSDVSSPAVMRSMNVGSELALSSMSKETCSRYCFWRKCSSFRTSVLWSILLCPKYPLKSNEQTR